MLGRPRRHRFDRRVGLHSALRLLRDRHRQTVGIRHRRAAPRRRSGGKDGAQLCRGDGRRPRRSARRCRLAVRRNLPPDQGPTAALWRRASDRWLSGSRRTAPNGARRQTGGAGTQSRNTATTVPPRAARFPLQPVPGTARPGTPLVEQRHQIQPDSRDGRDRGRGRGGNAWPARGGVHAVDR